MPENPDRYLIRDGAKSRLWEITKAARMAHLYITSDCIILAVWKKHKISGKTNLVAYKIFDYREFSLQDVSDTPEYINAFKITSETGDLFYRCEFLEEKTKIFIEIERCINASPNNGNSLY